MDIAVLIFDRLTALDAVGPWEVLSLLPEADVALVAADPGLKRAHQGGLGLVADHSLDDHRAPDVVVVAGGPGQEEAARDERVLDWLRRVHETTTWTTSVCTGALILGAAGLLSGRRATTHWLAMDELAGLGAEPVSERVVTDGRLMTAAGVSAGIDMALVLAARLAGEEVAQAIQLGIEYDPRPPFSAGSPQTAPAGVVNRLRRGSRFGGGR